MDTQIKAWGNSQGVRLPKEVLKEAGFQLDETLEITVSQGEIILHRAFRHKTLKERAAAYGGKLMLMDEVDYGDPAGGEIW